MLPGARRMDPSKTRTLVFGGIAGVIYGILAYVAFARHPGGGGVASLSFLVLVPLGMAAIPLLFSDADQVRWYRRALFMPWISVVGLYLFLLAVRLEDLLCVLLLAGPFVMVVSLVTWVVRAVMIRRASTARRRAVAATLLCLPFVVLATGAEDRLLVGRQTVTVREEVVVAAAADAVWRQIVEVPLISPRELPAGPFNRLGIPRPLSATADAHRAGGVRTGMFEGGLRFREPIRAFEPGRRLTLDVEADAASVPDAPSLRHVFGRGYFHIDEVSYEIEARPDGGTRLVLGCRYSLHTSVNPYGRVWADLIIADFERRLLQVIAARAEREARARPPGGGGGIAAGGRVVVPGAVASQRPDVVVEGARAYP